MADEPLQQLRAVLVAGRMDAEAFVSLLSEDIVWDLSRSGFPDAGIYYGIDGVRDWFRGLTDAFGDAHYEVEQMQEADERVAALMQVRGHGPNSGIDVEYRFAVVYSFQEGKIVRMDRYDDWATALDALAPPA